TQDHPPQADNAWYTTTIGQQLADSLLGDASDPDGDALTFSRVSQAGHGSVTVHGDGSFVYTPNSQYLGPDRFTFQVSDGTSASPDVGPGSCTYHVSNGTDASNVATVTIDVQYPANPQDLPPRANNYWSTSSRGGELFDSLRGAASDPAGGTLTFIQYGGAG